jgi:hypothetical protein
MHCDKWDANRTMLAPKNKKLLDLKPNFIVALSYLFSQVICRATNISSTVWELRHKISREPTKSNTNNNPPQTQNKDLQKNKHFAPQNKDTKERQ